MGAHDRNYSLLSDGMAWRPRVHVEDVARVTLALLDTPDEHVLGEVFNIGTDEQNYVARPQRRFLTFRAAPTELAEGSSSHQRSYRVESRSLSARRERLRSLGTAPVALKDR
jgi:nucleoside-diphosphate-sugar epimerase